MTVAHKIITKVLDMSKFERVPSGRMKIGSDDVDEHWSHPDIDITKDYLVRTTDYGWQLGTFGYQWYGLVFHGSSVSNQLSYGSHPRRDGWCEIHEVRFVDDNTIPESAEEFKL